MSDKVLSLSRKGFLSAEILTDAYRFSGEVNLKGQPLVDTLNDKLSAYLRLENVYVSPVNDPTVFKAQSNIGSVRKDNIRAVILAREEDGMARHTLYSVKADTPVYWNLFSTSSGYEVRGGLKVASPVDVENMLMQSVDPFITIYRGTISLTANPEIQFTGGSILLNREMVNIFCLEKAT